MREPGPALWLSENGSREEKAMVENKRETGARKLEPVHRSRETDQNAGMSKKPAPYGLTEPIDDVDEKTRHSDGVNPHKNAADKTTVEGKDGYP
jgi:hypothetical protein